MTPARSNATSVKRPSDSYPPIPDGVSAEPNVADIGRRINTLRNDKDLSLGELASQAGVSKSYLSTVEKGSGSRPGAAVLHKIADALGITLADLVGREINAEPHTIPDELREFAIEKKLHQRDIDMLAGIAFRGQAPKTKERWAYIYNAISMSAALDHIDR
ncbi:transcriptional regulator with XRE-family HTH domain [Nocardioides ginsengisegetis]|uniref:Transcriptional regulator with XRE-family HTH domain n=1 Tax=Nocardioides ginsengisegetis TaxID=661491 RepID=A0A7W3P9X2_9ACTN|nr:helix-turn-helix domain-containing protein [Nocardioides ginsengisegetis]MBA8804165.1 transcriptional regulator with XRE-family HTH domain [Nocardioides ginsengisegetis]